MRQFLLLFGTVMSITENLSSQAELLADTLEKIEEDLKEN